MEAMKALQVSLKAIAMLAAGTRAASKFRRPEPLSDSAQERKDAKVLKRFTDNYIQSFTADVLVVAPKKKSPARAGDVQRLEPPRPKTVEFEPKNKKVPLGKKKFNWLKPLFGLGKSPNKKKCHYRGEITGLNNHDHRGSRIMIFKEDVKSKKSEPGKPKVQLKCWVRTVCDYNTYASKKIAKNKKRIGQFPLTLQNERKLESMRASRNKAYARSQQKAKRTSTSEGDDGPECDEDRAYPGWLQELNDSKNLGECSSTAGSVASEVGSIISAAGSYAGSENGPVVDVENVYATFKGLVNKKTVSVEIPYLVYEQLCNEPNPSRYFDD